MGAPYFDYILADATVIPEEHRTYYTERVVTLPDTYQCNDRQRPQAADILRRTDVGLPAQGFVFCCFNNNYKIAPEIFSVWMRLLHQAPDSVLWLLEDNADASHNLKRSAEAQGIAANRLVFAPRVNAAAIGRPADVPRPRLSLSPPARRLMP